MIIIIGAGIAGLSLGWRLAQSGAPVTVIEQNKIGSAASYAAAAYLEPRLGTGAMRELEWAAVRLWRRFAQEVEDSAGQSIDYRRDGQVRIAYKETCEKAVADHKQRLLEGWRSEWMDAAELRQLEPNLSDEIVAGSYLPDVDWCDGRKLCAALSQGIVKAGGQVVEHARVVSLATDADRLTSVTLENGDTYGGDKFVVCVGLGGADIARLPADIPTPRPVKGVMLALDMDPDAPLIRRLIKRPDGILCPRSDGRLLVGVTHEDGATSLTASKKDIAKLLDSAVRAVPGIKQLRLREAAVGIRSLVGDGTLRLGRSRRLQGLYYSLSHAGAGFLRAPAISQELAEFVLSDQAECPNIETFLRR